MLQVLDQHLRRVGQDREMMRGGLKAILIPC